MVSISYISVAEINKVRKKIAEPLLRAKILADILRLNTLSMIMEAGSGHIGTSFSCMDIITWLWTEVLQNPNEADKNPSDTYFSSKGHDAPALYSLLIGLGKLPFEKIHTLRRLGGLPGHPDVSIPYMVTNTGSLGMGISKARGMAQANRLRGKSGHFYVLTGDGELQEGQIWESLQPTANHKFSEITVIVDYNKIQSDTYVSGTSDLGDLEAKFRSFGWETARCDGHDFTAVKKKLEHFKTIKDRPQILIADTIKGKGVSFMEKTDENGFYKFHSGAPSAENYQMAARELLSRANNLLKEAKISLKPETFEIPDRVSLKDPEKLVEAYGNELLKIARERKDIIGLDADLVLDTGMGPFKKEFPERHIECGIAEQDMVSMAGGLALRGFLPVVHSFACFLATRPNEQIFNNASERTKIIYAGSLAGLLPATPGHSHQMVRDISAIGSVPGLTLVEPCNEAEARQAIRWAVERNPESTYIRLVSIPVSISYKLPVGYKLEKGMGVFLKEGEDVAIVSYGPVMLEESYKAAILLGKEGVSVAVINFPWLNFADESWLAENLKKFRAIFAIDDHFINLGQGMVLASALARVLPMHPKIINLGIEDIPVCGQNREVLEYHGLDDSSLVSRIKNSLLKLK